MTDTTTAPMTVAREHADKSWQMFALGRDVPDTNPDWQETVAPDGARLLSGRLVGRRPVWALERFARDFHVTLAHPGDMRPQFDVTLPGRTVLVWRCAGVWVELWHPDTASDTPHATEPVCVAPAPTQPAPKTVPAESGPSSLLSRIRPSARLPFTRRKKEITTA